MPSLEKLIRITLKLNDEVSQPIQKAGMSLKQFGDGLSSLGTKMTVGLTAPLVAFGTASVKAAMDLDKAMRNIQSVGGQTESQIKALSQTFVDMSTDITKTTDTAENLALAFYDIQGSGFEGADAMKILEAATMAASAGLTTTATSAQGMVAVLNSYGMAAEDAAWVSDIMFTTVDRGVGSFEELVSSLSNVTPTAAAMGIGIDQVSAAIATMSKQGFTFSEATVSLNQALTEMLKPGEDLAKAINELGYSSGQAMIDALGLGGAMQALRDHTGGTAEGMANLFGNVRSMRAAFALTGNGAQSFSENMLAMAEATGRTAEAYAVQAQSFDALWKSMQNNVNALMVEVGNLLMPLLSKLIKETLIPFVQWLRSLDEGTQSNILKFLAFAAALGPILTIIGQLISVFGALKGAILAISTGALPALAGALTFLFTPIGLLVALIIGAIALIIFNWDTLVNAVTQGGQLIAFAWASMFKQASETARQLVVLFTWAWGEMLSQAWTSLSQLGQITGAFVSKAGTSLNQLSQIVSIKTKQAGDTLSQSVKTWGNNANMLGTIFQMLGQKIQNSLSPVITAFKNIGIGMMNGLISGIKSQVDTVIKFVFNLAKGAANAVKSALGIKSPSKVFAQIGKNVVQGFNQGIDAMGGLGVNTPTVNGAALSSNPTMGIASGNRGLVGAGANQVFNIYTQGTTEEQMRQIARFIGKETKKRS